MRLGVWSFVGALMTLTAVAVALFVTASLGDGPRRAALHPPRASVSATSATKPEAQSASASPRAVLAALAPAHVAVLVMENESYRDVIGSPDAPFVTGLSRTYAVASRMYAVSHPSLPNYLALTGGSTFGIRSDCTDCVVRTTGLPDQLQGAHISWKAYMESIPRPCFRGGGSGAYAKRHDPFLYYRHVARNWALCDHVVPLRQLHADEQAGTLPRFIWITPNLCHDMHDCDVSTGDRFLSGLVPPLLSLLGPNGVLFLTWDEGSSDSGCCSAGGGGHIATIVAGPGALLGARLTTPADHYSVLQAIEDLLSLPRLRGAACACTPSLRPLLAG